MGSTSRTASSSAAALEVHNLTKLYGSFRAVDGVSFSVPRGKIVGLLGPNGAGKTTTIQMLVGITLPDGGAIRYFGQDLQSHRQACLQRINFSSSYNNLQGRITVWENLVVFARLYRVDQAEAKIHELGKYFAIDELMNQRFLTLSAGQRTRVNLVKALLNDPEVILMDEPTASLDPDIADRMLSLIESLRASRDLAIVYTSHQMDEVTRICDEVIFLDHGRIVAHDTPAGLTSRFASTELRVTFSGLSRATLEVALSPAYPDLTFPGANTVVVQTAATRVPEAIFAIAQTGAEISDIDIQKPTLEDVFLHIARGGSSSPSSLPATIAPPPVASAPLPPLASTPDPVPATEARVSGRPTPHGAVRVPPTVVSWTRISAVLLQELYITARSVEVLVDLPFWSVMTALVFGFVTIFFSTVMNPTVAQYLYVGTLLWEIMRVTQYSMSLAVLWNVWSHNFSNMFISPLSMAEYVVAQMISALVKAIVLFGLVAAIAALAFGVNLFAMGAANLGLLFVNLLWFGYSIGLLILGIIFRLGTRIQALAWGLLLVFQPLTAAYFPLSVMPAPLQAIARLFPPTFVFEAARASLADPSIRWPDISFAAAENVVYFVLCSWFFRYMYRRSRQTGQFARNEE